MRPVAIYEESPAEQGGMTIVVGSANEDDLTLRPCLKVDLQVVMEGHTLWSTFNSKNGSSSCRGNIQVGAMTEVDQVVVLEPRPYFGLPATVIALDGSLKSRFSGWSEDWHHTELKACATDPTDHIAVVMGTLKDRIVVELRVAWSAELQPMLAYQRRRQHGRDRFPWPRGN